MSGVVYDAGALVAAERSDRRVWADHRVRLEAGVVPVVADIADATVVTAAIAMQAQIVTSDRDDVFRLADAAGARLVIIEA